jgi:hypothetical protein
MKADLSYTPTSVFQTFPLPPGFEPNANNKSPEGSDPEVCEQMRERLDSLGSRLDVDRREIMLKLDIGLTKLYNLYHDPDLSPAAVIKEAKCGEADAAWAVEKLASLRQLHTVIDEAVRDAYGWKDLPLQHGFHELEFLPENDRVRYTVSDGARKTILAQLLKLNHQRHAEEVAAGLADEKGKAIKKNGAKAKKSYIKHEIQGDMFSGAAHE